MKKEDKKRPEKEEIVPADPIFLNSEKSLSFMIRDGDYTLREGVDYKVRYYRALDCDYPSNVNFVVVLKGFGKYSKTLFYGVEMGFPIEEKMMDYDAEMMAFLDCIESEIETAVLSEPPFFMKNLPNFSFLAKPSERHACPKNKNEIF